MAALIHVKLTGEGDFGPVDLECAIPPARLPVVMAALFGQPPQLSGDRITDTSTLSTPSRNATGMRSKAEGLSSGQSGGSSAGSLIEGADEGAMMARNGDIMDHRDASGPSVMAMKMPDVQGAGLDHTSESHTALGDAMDPGTFLTRFVGSLGELVARLQPRGFAETILIAAIWLHYRDGRNMVTRDDIRRVLRRQDHLRMPRNFSRDFHAALSRGYLELIENEGGYVVSSAGYQWFHLECRK